MQQVFRIRGSTDVRHHFWGGLVAKREIGIIHTIKSEYQHADFLTKPLDTDAFKFHLNS